MDKQAFKQRMQNLKSYRENNPGKGYWDWRNSLPDNLKYTDDTEYNMRGAYESGAQPILENEGFYHLPTRNHQTGEILNILHSGKDQQKMLKQVTMLTLLEIKYILNQKKKVLQTCMQMEVK